MKPLGFQESSFGMSVSFLLMALGSCLPTCLLLLWLRVSRVFLGKYCDTQGSSPPIDGSRCQLKAQSCSSARQSIPGTALYAKQESTG